MGHRESFPSPLRCGALLPLALPLKSTVTVAVSLEVPCDTGKPFPGCERILHEFASVALRLARGDGHQLGAVIEPSKSPDEFPACESPLGSHLRAGAEMRRYRTAAGSLTG